MDEDEITPPAEYVQGYNEGFVINKYQPDLVKELTAVLGDSIRSTGFKDSVEFFSKDKPKTNEPKFLREDRLKDINDRSFDKDQSLDKE